METLDRQPLKRLLLEVAWRFCHVKIKQVHGGCKKIVLLSGSAFWSIL